MQRRDFLCSAIMGFSAIGGCVSETNSRTPRADSPDSTDDSVGPVTIAYYPNSHGEYVNETVLNTDSFSSVGEVKQGRNNESWYIPVEIKQSDAESMANTLVEANYSDGTRCNYEGDFNYNDVSGRCLVTVRDKEREKVVFAGGVHPSLGKSFENGDFVEERSMRFAASNRTEIRRLRSYITQQN